jgi:hypothetical protein
MLFSLYLIIWDNVIYDIYYMAVFSVLCISFVLPMCVADPDGIPFL